MKVFEDFVETQDQIDTLNSLFQDDIVKTGVSCDITYSEANGQYMLTVYDANDAPVGSAKISDPIAAQSYLQSAFSLIPYDPGCADAAGQANGTSWGQGAVSSSSAHDDDIDGTPQGA